MYDLYSRDYSNALKATESLINTLIDQYENPQNIPESTIENFFSQNVHIVSDPDGVLDGDWREEMNKHLYKACPWLYKRVKPESKKEQLEMLKNDRLLCIVDLSIKYQLLKLERWNSFISLIPLLPLYYFVRPQNERPLLERKIEHIKYLKTLSNQTFTQAHNKLISENDYLGGDSLWPRDLSSRDLS